MDEEIDSLVIAVRADTGAFDRDVTAMKASLGQGLGGGADRAASSIERALGRAIGSGKLGFDELKSVALSALDQIAGAALKAGIGAAAGGSSGLTRVATSLLSSVLGLPGRATGGPVSPGAAYMVGERGPELFVPTASGSIAPIGQGGGRDVRVAISINAASGAEPQALARSSRQVARAVAQALTAAEG